MHVEDRGLIASDEIDALLETCELLAVVVRDPQGRIGLVMLAPPSLELASNMASAVHAYGEKVLQETETHAQAQNN